MLRTASWILNGAYLALLLVASPWIVWSVIRRGKYREGYAEKLFGRVPIRRSNGPCIWLHAVSVGEVNLLATAIGELKRRRDGLEIVISTTTKTGYELARRKYAAHAVFYCPLDFSWAARTAMRRVRPDLFVLAELELWPNLIAAAKAHGARVAVINGRLSDSSFGGYLRVRWLTSRVLRMIDLLAAQSRETAERFRQLGARAETVHTTGSLKFDGVELDQSNPGTTELRRLAGINDDDVVFLAGSTQAPEEQLAVNVFQRLCDKFPQLRLFIAPRHPERFDEVAALLHQSGADFQRRSKLQSLEHSTSRGSTTLGPRVLLVDTIGELRHWWGAAHVALVGGSFGDRGGQNMLEPAAYGAAVCFGPNTRNFRDIVAQLLAVDGARTIADERELEQFVRRSLTDSHWAHQLGMRAHKLVISQQGATKRTVDLILPLIAPSANVQPLAA